MVIATKSPDLSSTGTKSCEFIKRSPLKNEILQKYFREKYPNGFNVILNCKTRWSSLVNMLERIVQVKVPIQKALLDINQGIYFTDEELAMISYFILL